MGLLEPSLPPGAMKTYSIIAPEPTHFRPATCAEINCPQYLHGWRTLIDERTDLGTFQADYIRKSSGRGYSEERDEQGRTVFTFEAGQVCFAAADHRARVDKPELYVIRGGDHRGNPSGEVRTLSGPTPWVDDFGEHQETLAELTERG